MTQRTRIAWMKLAFLMTGIPVVALAYSEGPDAGKTFAPGDTTCIQSGCHSGTVGSGPGNVKITLPGNTTTYVPGQAMQILVQITDATKASYGFELTARSGAANTTVAGDFATTDANTQVVCGDSSIRLAGKSCPGAFPLADIEHSLTGYNASLKATPKGSYTFSFNWIPPAAGSGTVTLYVAANCGTGTQSSSGTNVYKASVSLAEATAPVPSINAGGVGPIYSKSTTIQPGSWISIYGTNLVSSLGIWDGSPPTPTTLGGASVTINGKPAYLWVAAPGSGGNPDQINAQAPDDTATGSVTVTVKNVNNGSTSSTATLASVGPSFNVLGDGANHAAVVILTPNGSGAFGGGTYDIDGPSGTSLGYPTRPAKAGDTVELFGVGFGPTNPAAAPAGQPFAGAARITSSLSLTIGGVPIPAANIPFVGLVGQGLYQFNVLIPSGLGTGDKALQAIVAGVPTPTGVVFTLQ